MKYKIGVVTGTRAEYGILKPLIEKINGCDNLELCLIVTGTHLEEKYGNTYKEIEKDNFKISYRIPMKLTSNSKSSILESMAIEMSQFGKILKDAKLDMMVVLGDRYEILVAATAATIFNIPIAHLHGGEITEGAIDDAIRHSITKMSYLHFASTEEYANRIIQMGESPDRVFNVGALGVENTMKCPLLTREELSDKFSKLFTKKYALVTFHPVTLDEIDSADQFKILLDVINDHNEFNYIFTYANADADGSKINKIIDDFVSKKNNTIAYKSMGQIGYLSAAKYCEFVIGNSSSGIIEVPSFAKPTINIGDRQKGRIYAESVINCSCTKNEIDKAIDFATNMHLIKVKNPYEGENTSDKILEIILEALRNGINIKKRFYNME